MKKISLLTIVVLTFFAACKKDSVKVNNNTSRKTDTLQGAITTSMTLDPNKNYYLKGQVYVKNNSTLTIPAGITVFAQVNADRSAKSVLVITSGAQSCLLMARQTSLWYLHLLHLRHYPATGALS